MPRRGEAYTRAKVQIGNPEMILRAGRVLRNPTLLVTAIALLAAALVQSGELGSSDTTHRLRTAHSFWTSEPPVLPDEYPEFGIHGRNGKLYGWSGMGQSLLMVPADVVGTYMERLPMFAQYEGIDPTVRSIVVSYTTNILVCAARFAWCASGCLACFRFSTFRKGWRACWRCCWERRFCTTRRT